MRRSYRILLVAGFCVLVASAACFVLLRHDGKEKVAALYPEPPFTPVGPDFPRFIRVTEAPPKENKPAR